jgi:molecular chaperone GrpE (heat shock protein)
MEEVGRALDQIDELPAAEPAPDEEAPDLYSFFGQLTVLTTESRKGNRRTAEAFSQWGEVLGRFDVELRQVREHLARLAATALQPEAVPRPYCLSLIELTDRLERLLRAFDSAPAQRWWLNDAPWRAAWETQRQGLAILLTHVCELLKKTGVTRLDTLGRPYDPTVMVAVATEPRTQSPSHTVIEELAGGYLLGRDLLRPAQVKISINPPNS